MPGSRSGQVSGAFTWRNPGILASWIGFSQFFVAGTGSQTRSQTGGWTGSGLHITWAGTKSLQNSESTIDGQKSLWFCMQNQRGKTRARYICTWLPLHYVQKSLQFIESTIEGQKSLWFCIQKHRGKTRARYTCTWTSLYYVQKSHFNVWRTRVAWKRHWRIIIWLLGIMKCVRDVKNTCTSTLPFIQLFIWALQIYPKSTDKPQKRDSRSILPFIYSSNSITRLNSWL